ncbi:hypothetical protein ACLOJK_015614 [Asimina triloba]
MVVASFRWTVRIESDIERVGNSVSGFWSPETWTKTLLHLFCSSGVSVLFPSLASVPDDKLRSCSHAGAEMAKLPFSFVLVGHLQNGTSKTFHNCLLRCGKSCRLRWTNYLRPDIKRGPFTPDEEKTIIQLHAIVGNR